jgi:prepilin peptidase CpaA
MDLGEGGVLLVLTAVLIAAAFQDVRFRKIPNWLTLSTATAAILGYTLLRGSEGLLFSLSGALVGVALMILPYILGGMGAGDAKLMGAVGAILGARGVFNAFLCAALIGGVYAIIVLISNGLLRKALSRYWLMLRTLAASRKFTYVPPSMAEEKPRLRYGIAIALGTLISVLLREIYGYSLIYITWSMN